MPRFAESFSRNFEHQEHRDSDRNKFESVGESELTPEEEKIYKLAIAKDQERPIIQEFVDFEDDPDFYTAQKVAVDQAKLDKFDQARKENPKTKRGVILEYILGRHLEASDWFGERCLVCDTTLYDDEKNKTDLVLEFIEKGEDGELTLYRLAVDVTSTQNDRNYMAKHDRITEGLDNGVMARLKYFTSQAEQKKVGFIKNVPKVVLALGPKSIQRLAKDFKYSHDLFQAARQEESPMRAKKLRAQALAVMENNPVQLALIEQIHRQMQDQMMYVIWLILNELDNDFRNFTDGPEAETKIILSEISNLYSRVEKNWEINVEEIDDYADRVIGVFFRSQNLLARLSGKTKDDQGQKNAYFNPLISQHLETLNRLRPILNISQELLAKKKEQLGLQKVEVTSARMRNNVVIENSIESLKNFYFPPKLAKKLPAQILEVKK